MVSKKKVLVLGSIAFDYIMGFAQNFINSGAVSVDKEKKEYQSTITADSRVQHFGGTAGNIAYNLGLMDTIGASLLGSVGKDFDSLGYKEHIINFKNICLGVDIHDDLFTAACYIVNDMNSNQMIIFHGGALEKTKDIDLKQKIKNPEDYIYAINSTQGVDAMASFTDQLFELQIPMIFDPGQVVPIFPVANLIDSIKKTEILISNKYENEQIREKTGLSEEELLNSVKSIIVTKGAEGSELIYKDDQKTYHVNIPICEPNEIIDTTGAGDGYRAGILAGLSLDMTLLDSCRLGSVISSFVIETAGAQTQQYKLGDIKKRFLKTYKYIPQELEGI